MFVDYLSLFAIKGLAGFGAQYASECNLLVLLKQGNPKKIFYDVIIVFFIHQR
jgi:hypothetical protein